MAHRKLLGIYGREAKIFLQALMTNDVNLFNAQSPLLYTSFLNSKGRFIFDGFLYCATFLPENLRDALSVPKDHAFLLDLHEDTLDAAVSHLKTYVLRSKVSFQVIDKGTINFMMNKPVSNDDESFIIEDPRRPTMGFRMLTTTACHDDDDDADSPRNRHSTMTKKDYFLRRFCFGVPEAAEDGDFTNAIPFDICLDQLNAVAIKGCYLGQELIVRTRHTGTIRKRMIPVVLHPESQNLQFEVTGDSLSDPRWKERIFGSCSDADLRKDEFFEMTHQQAILSSQGTKIGKLINLVDKKYGFALMKLDSMKEARVQLSDGSTLSCTPFPIYNKESS